MAEELRWFKTHCARMDHGGCALLVGVRDNQIVQIKGDPDGYLNRGYTCLKGRVSADRLTHPDRLKHPLKRAGKRGEGKWRRISWGKLSTKPLEACFASRRITARGRWGSESACPRGSSISS